MTSLEGYSRYETKFVELWGLWVASPREGEATPNLLKKDKSLVGLCEPLCKTIRKEASSQLCRGNRDCQAQEEEALLS